MVVQGFNPADNAVSCRMVTAIGPVWHPEDLPTRLKSRIIALRLRYRQARSRKRPKNEDNMESHRSHPLVNGAASPRPAQAAPRYPWLKTYPSDIDWQETFQGRPLPSLLEETAGRFPDRVATNFLGRELSYAKIQSAVDCVARG